MKKLLLLSLILCLIVCGCSKEEPKTDNKPIETTTPTTESTPTAEPTPTEKPKIACQICGRITECNEFIQTRYNAKIDRDVDKAYYLCDKCYAEAETDEADVKTYDELKSYILLATAEKEVSEKDLHGTVFVSKEGVSYIGVNDTMLNCIHKMFKDDTKFKTSKVYSITIDKYIDLSEKPTSILDILD